MLLSGARIGAPGCPRSRAGFASAWSLNAISVANLRHFNGLQRKPSKMGCFAGFCGWFWAPTIPSGTSGRTMTALSPNQGNAGFPQPVRDKSGIRGTSMRTEREFDGQSIADRFEDHTGIASGHYSPCQKTRSGFVPCTKEHGQSAITDSDSNQTLNRALVVRPLKRETLHSGSGCITEPYGQSDKDSGSPRE